MINYPGLDGSREKYGLTFHKCLCGADAVAYLSPSTGLWTVLCVNCEIRTLEHDELEAARVAWNSFFTPKADVEYELKKSHARRFMMENVKRSLHVGDEFKSYAELALCLGEKIEAGNRMQKKQIDRWKMFFKWKRAGENKTIVIKEIYDEPRAVGAVLTTAPKRHAYRTNKYKAIKEGTLEEFNKETAKRFESFDTPTGRPRGRPKKLDS